MFLVSSSRIPPAHTGSHKHSSIASSQKSSSSSSRSLLHPSSLCRAGGHDAARHVQPATPVARPQWHGHARQQAAPAAPAAAAPAAQAVAATAHAGLRVLYPQLAPHDSGYLKVSALHTLYYEVYGNPRGVPAVVVHGGPGAACFANHARFFDPAHYRIILVDQRGCGRSTPFGCLEDNTTADLVGDLEHLRKALGVQQWLMLGGSWGVTLTLAYAQAYPAHVLGMVLRGVCLMRPQEITWMFGGGAAALKPLSWTRFLQQLPEPERTNPLLAYYRRLLSPDANTRSQAAQSWAAWEMAVGSSSGQNVVVWDGQQWGEQATPAVAGQQQLLQQQQRAAPVRLQPPPRPQGPAAASAAAAAAAGLMPLLHRDFSGSAWFSTLQQPQQLGENCVPSATAALASSPAAASAAQQLSSSSNAASPDSLQHQSRRNGGAHDTPTSVPSGLKSDNSSSSSNAGLTGSHTQQQQQQQQEQQSAQIELIQQGLQHRGFGASGQAQALLEAHYSVHGAFLQQQPVLDHVSRVRHLPCIAVQGQWDLVCPPTTAVELSQAYPEMELRLVPRAGHSMYDPAITHELVTATDRMRLLRPAAAAAAAGKQQGKAAAR